MTQPTKHPTDIEIGEQLARFEAFRAASSGPKSPSFPVWLRGNRDGLDSELGQDLEAALRREQAYREALREARRWYHEEQGYRSVQPAWVPKARALLGEEEPTRGSAS